MLAALLLPRVLETLPDRTVMLGGATTLIVGLFLGTFVSHYALMLPLWFSLGAGYAIAQTPSGRLLRRSAHPEDRPALFAAQFVLSHGCWLMTYPIAGWMGAQAGVSITFLALAAVAMIAAVLALTVWPRHDTQEIEHFHPDLAGDDPHLVGAAPEQGGYRHRHTFVIDSHHSEWPR